MAPKFRLGKGLDALLPPERNESPAPEVDPADAPEGRICFLPLDALMANPNQARKRFDEDKLRELADSIRQYGVIDPLIVEAAEDGRYSIIGGERRYRAAALAGLSAVPALIRRFSDAERMEVALVENIQRADLNPVEEALAYRKLMELTGLSQDEVALRVGKNRSTVANTLRLLKLPPVILEALEQSALSSGHGRALLAAADPADQESLFQEILGRGKRNSPPWNSGLLIPWEPRFPFRGISKRGVSRSSIILWKIWNASWKYALSPNAGAFFLAFTTCPA